MGEYYDPVYNDFRSVLVVLPFAHLWVTGAEIVAVIVVWEYSLTEMKALKSAFCCLVLKKPTSISTPSH